MTNETSKDSSSEKRGATDRKPYKPPSFLFERVFEVSALSCGKIDVTQGTCHSNRKVS
jgi:hypothetical protein